MPIDKYRSLKTGTLLAASSLPTSSAGGVSMRRHQTVLLVAALAACTQEGGTLSLDEGRKCAAEAFAKHSGSFSRGQDTISYGYESAHGPAKIIVVFDARRRPVRTFFESAPHGSHKQLM